MARDAQLEIPLLPMEPGDLPGGLCRDTPGNRVTLGMSLRNLGMRGPAETKPHQFPWRGKRLEVQPKPRGGLRSHSTSFFILEHEGIRNDEANQTKHTKICALQRLSCSIPQQPSVRQAPVPRYQINNDSFPFCVCKSIVIMP